MMNSTSTPSPSDPIRARALRGLIGRFRTLLAESDDDGPGFEEIARAVDGELDAVELELWSARTAADPQLEERFAALQRFRAEAYPANAGVLEFRPRPQRRAQLVPWLGWAAAAATILVAVLLRFGAGPGAPPESMRAGAPGAGHSVESTVESTVQSAVDHELFSDGFEAGDPSNWTVVSTSG